MNPLLRQVLGTLARTALAALGGYLASEGLWTMEEAEKYAAAASPIVAALGWSVWQKYHSQQKLVVALGSSQPMTEKQVETHIKTVPDAVPSVTTPKTQIPSP